MKLKYTLLIITLILFSACKAKDYVPQEGDLIFKVAAYSDFSKAITDATATQSSIQFDHVAIVALEKGKPYIIEASSKKGVVRTKWEDFISSATSINGKPGLVVMRIHKETNLSLSEAVATANTFIGEEYDWSFYPDNGKMYCSELVYESFRKTDGSHLFTTQPMNFRNTKGNMPTFWIDLFKKLRKPIPEGIPGTNPNEMSKDPALEEIYSFF